MPFIKTVTFRNNNFEYHVKIMFSLNHRTFYAMLDTTYEEPNKAIPLQSPTFDGLCQIIEEKLNTLSLDKANTKRYIHYRFYNSYFGSENTTPKKEDLLKYNSDHCTGFALTWDIYESCDGINFFKGGRRYIHSDLQGKFIKWTKTMQDNFEVWAKEMQDSFMELQHLITTSILNTY